MLKSYVKIAWRNLLKNKLYSTINLIGLTIGMTCFILIAFFIQFELSFDNQHDKADRIYRVVQRQTGNEFRGTDYFAVTPRPLGIAMKMDFPEVEAITNLGVNTSILARNETPFSARGLYTDSQIFDVFTIPILAGQGPEALSDPNSIILTESLAKKMFGELPALHQTLLYNSKHILTINGIVADPPKNQHITYSYIAPLHLEYDYDADKTKWTSNDYYTYFVLAKGFNDQQLEAKLAGYEQLTKPAYKTAGFHFYPKFVLQPLMSVHLESKMNIEVQPNGDILYIYFFAGIALIILVLASINYMNLATSKSAQRAKEVGVAKVLGAKKAHLILLFLSESFLVTLASFLCAMLLAYLLLPRLNELLNIEIPFELLSNWWMLSSMLILVLIIGVLSGLYPALFLSGVSPIKALKGTVLSSYKDKALLRNGLVIGQFVAAITLAIGSVIVHQQLQFIQHKKLGYNRSQVVHVRYGEEKITNKADHLRTQLLSNPKIRKVSISTQLPMNLHSQGPVDSWEGNNNNNQLFVYRGYVDYDFMDLFEMELVEGRGFSREFATDSAQAYVLNESAIKKLGWKTAVGKKFNDGFVIGVVKDFHLQTFDLAIEPLFLTMHRDGWNRKHGQVILKVDMEDYKTTRSFITKTMNSIAPLAIYNVHFMEDSYAQLYKSETRLGKAFTIFSLLALFIAAIGLIGLVSFQVLQRTKEIGIRKVLGSSAMGIVQLLTKDFLKLVIIAMVISIPIGYYLMHHWLESYAYSIQIQWWVFVVVGASILGISFITISLQSLRAAATNPVKSLRTE